MSYTAFRIDDIESCRQPLVCIPSRFYGWNGVEPNEGPHPYNQSNEPQSLTQNTLFRMEIKKEP